MKTKQKYVEPTVTMIDSSEILEALGPASACGGISPGGWSGGGGWHRRRHHHWHHSDVDPDFEG